MNTKESIKLMKVIREILPEHYNFDFGKPEIDEVIKRLQMWEDFKEHSSEYYCSKEKELKNIRWWNKYRLSVLMDEFEQEYFPKDKSADELCKLVDKIKEVMNKGLITAEELAERLTPKD